MSVSLPWHYYQFLQGVFRCLLSVMAIILRMSHHHKPPVGPLARVKQNPASQTCYIQISQFIRNESFLSVFVWWFDLFIVDKSTLILLLRCFICNVFLNVCLYTSNLQNNKTWKLSCFETEIVFVIILTISCPKYLDITE